MTTSPRTDFPWILYGANGHTGRRIAQQAVAQNIPPLLAGRNTREIEALARELKCPHRVFSLDDTGQVTEQIRGSAVVLNCAGPFSATSVPMLEACLLAKVHYLDITGEIPAIEAAATRHERAVAAGISLLPAVAFDVVPSDCLAAMLAARLPGATRLQLASTAMTRISRGTARTIAEQLPRGGRARRDGNLVEVPIAEKTIDVRFPSGMQQAALVGLADLVTAWHSTNIPNIETYTVMPAWQGTVVRQMRWLTGAMKVEAVRDVAGSLLRAALSGGPSRPGKGHAAIWGRACDHQDHCVEAIIETIDPYEFTVRSALAAIERVLGGKTAPGFQTPSKAFGPEFALRVPGTKVSWLDAAEAALPPSAPSNDGQEAGQ